MAVFDAIGPSAKKKFSLLQYYTQKSFQCYRISIIETNQILMINIGRVHIRGRNS